MNVKNILAVRNDRFGEFLLNIPALRALKETYPEARLVLAVNPYVKELAGCINFVDEIILWENKKHGFFEIVRFSRKLKKRKFDLCVIFNPSREFNIISFLAGIPARVGYDRKWPFLLTHKIKDKKHLGDKHEVEYNLELVSLVGAKTEDKSLSLSLNDDIINGLPPDFNSDNALILHPWASDVVKQWPKERFYALAERLIRELKVRVVLVGGKENIEEAETLFSGIKENLIDLTGKTSLRQLAVLLKKVKLLISPDSGPAHLASCVGAKVIALFRSDLAGKTARRWGPWGEGQVVIEKNKLSDISVEEVFNKIKGALKK